MRTPVICLIMICCASAAGAATIITSNRSINAVSASHTCAPEPPVHNGYSVIGENLTRSATSAGLFDESVIATTSAPGYGGGSAGQSSMLGANGIEVTSLFAAVTQVEGGACLVSSATGRSARASISVTFQVSEPTRYIFTGSLIQTAFSFGFSGLRQYSLNFAGQGFSGSFINGASTDGSDLSPDLSRSFSTEGILQPGTYSFWASMEVSPESPPSLSSSTNYRMTASLQFVPEPGGTFLALWGLGILAGSRRRPGWRSTNK